MPRTPSVKGRGPRRGEVWFTDLRPTRGHEQYGERPFLVISVDAFNLGMAGIHMGVPLTTTRRGLVSHVHISPPEGGVAEECFAMCEQIRTISRDRFLDFWGAVGQTTIDSVETRIKALLGIH